MKQNIDKNLMIPSFTAIDFETANGEYNSICQIGLVRVENGCVTHKVSQLVQPPGNRYHWGNSRVHGINRRITASSPAFSEVWHLIAPYIAGQRVVAHNAPFDIACIKKTLAYYGFQEPPFESDCTYKIYKKNLKALCEHYRILLNHHDALSDANACAELYLRYLRGEEITHHIQ